MYKIGWQSLKNVSSDRDYGASEAAHAHPAADVVPAANVLPAAAHPVSAQWFVTRVLGRKSFLTSGAGIKPYIKSCQQLKRFRNMFSGSSPCLLGQHGSCSSAQLPVELSVNMLQNLFLNLPPHSVLNANLFAYLSQNLKLLWCPLKNAKFWDNSAFIANIHFVTLKCMVWYLPPYYQRIGGSESKSILLTFTVLVILIFEPFIILKVWSDLWPRLKSKWSSNTLSST